MSFIHVTSLHGRNLAAGCILLTGALFSMSALAIDSFTGTYGNGTSCSSTFNIEGREPSTAGTYPVFIYTVGTGESYTSPIAIAAIQGMANRGYVAASVQYPNSTFGSCSTIGNRAKCIYNPSSANSAVSKICARTKADCSKGIVVAGLSQGSVIAVLAKNTEPRVRAAYATGTWPKYSFFDLSSCMNNGKHTIQSSQLRIVNGDNDQFDGGSLSAARTNTAAVSGVSCGSTAFSCLQPNGSGWYLVQAGEVQDGNADHCYMLNGDGCKAGTPLDTGWQNGSSAWDLNPNLDWLTTQTSH